MNKYILFVFLSITTSIIPQTWKQSEQPDGGEIISLDISASDSNKIVAMTRRFLENIIWYSSDRGLNWKKIGYSKHTGDVRIDPLNNRIYATGFSEVLITSDYGNTWTRTLTSGNYPGDLQYNPHNHSEVLFSNRDGIYRSTDYGSTWSLVFPEYNANTLTDISFSPKVPGLVIVKKISGMLISFNSGVDWQFRDIPQKPYERPILFDPFNDSTLYTSCYIDENNPTIVKKSSDLGLFWEILPDKTFIPYLCYEEDVNTVFLTQTYDGIKKTTDLGVSWTLISPITTQRPLLFNGKNLYAAFNPPYSFAIYRGDNNWSFRNKGMKAYQFESLSAHDSTLFLSSYYCTYRKRGTGEFKVISTSNLTHITYYNDTSAFAVSSRSIYKSTDDGNTWNLFSNMQNYVQDIKVIGNYLIAAVNSEFGYDKGLYKTPLTQTSWVKIFEGPNDAVIYDGTNLYGFSSLLPGHLAKSTNLGNSWYEYIQLAVNMEYRAFAVKDNPKGFFLGGYKVGGDPSLSTPGVLYFIKPDGTYSTLFSKNIYNVIAPSRKKEYYVIQFAMGKIMKADSIGAPLIPYEDSLITIINDQGGMDLFLCENSIYKNKLFTNRGGLMETEITGSTVIGINEQPSLPEKHNLAQNYPNPFNPTTTIKYSVAENSRVTLRIYNPLGREITKLLDEEKPAGTYEIHWNASSYPSGVYFLKMQSGSFTQTRKLLLLK